ncbi:hypothetical protein BC938DRAFT_470797, partial [Jimgerdemannia flammicorona]
MDTLPNHRSRTPSPPGDSHAIDIIPVSTEPPRSARRNIARLSAYIQPTAQPKLDEYRKAINLILTRMRKRKKPPNPLQHLARPPGASENYDNDEAVTLLGQLRDVLVIFNKQGWTLKNWKRCAKGFCLMAILWGPRTCTESPGSSRSNSPAPSPRTSSPRANSPDRAVDPTLVANPLDIHNTTSSSQTSKSDLAKILDLLSDVIQNDCRFRITQPRPSRPPAALQSVVLDLATLLVKQDPLNPPWLYELGTMMLPAFDCFEQGVIMGRVVAFYVDWIVPQLIASKEEKIGRGREGRRDKGGEGKREKEKL